MQNIKFIGAPKHLLNEGALSSVLVHYASCEGYTIGALEYNFIDSEKMYSLNKQHLNHLTDTDIITFDYSTDVISGDLFISIDRVEENATLNNVSFLEEIYRVVAHGCLHLCGYKDKEPGDVVIMREKEDFAISLVVSRETKN